MPSAYTTGTTATGTTRSVLRWNEMTPNVTSPAVEAPAEPANHQNRAGSRPEAAREVRGATAGTGEVRARVRRRRTTSRTIRAALGTTSTARPGQSRPVSAA